MTDLSRVVKRVLQCKAMMKGVGTSNPYYVTWSLTSKCNAQCKMCGVWRVYQDNPSRIENELSREELYQIFRHDLPEPLWLTLSGGEPFLREDLTEIVSDIHECYPNLYGLGLSTNGFQTDLTVLMTGEMLKLNFHHLIVSVSIDGIGSVHDEIRGVKGAYKKAVETYMALKDLEGEFPNFRTGINYTISQYNAGRLEEFLLFNNIVDSDRVDISLSHSGVGFGKTESPGLPPQKEALNDLQYLLERYKASSSRGRIKKIFIKYALKYMKNPQEMVLPCSAFSAACFIDPYGNLYPCTIWNHKIGSLKTSSFKELWTSNLARKTREMISLEECPICFSGCESTHVILQRMPWILKEAYL